MENQPTHNELPESNEQFRDSFIRLKERYAQLHEAYTHLHEDNRQSLEENCRLQNENLRLQEENSRLREEIKSLKDENDALKREIDVRQAELHVDGKVQGTLFGKLTLEEKVALFRSLFRGREDVFARRWYSKNSGKSGYQPVCVNEWDRILCDKRRYKCAECPSRQFKALAYEDLYRHLEGKSEDGCDVIGIYPILKDNKCCFLCADFDDKSCTRGYQKDVAAYVRVCNEIGIHGYVERSRSGNGAHVWIFFDKPIEAAKARKLGNTILTRAMEDDARMSFKSYDRLFPNQDRLPEGGLGNLVAAPLQGKARKAGNSVFVDANFEAYPDQWHYLQSIVKTTEGEVDALLNKYGMPSELGELSTSNENTPWSTPKIHTIGANDFYGDIAIVRANLIYMPLEALSAKAVNHLKRIASFKNPEFYARQGMGLSVYNVPRVISCADVMEKYLALPRGCEDAVRGLLDGLGIPYHVRDETRPGVPISVRFTGSLRIGQAEAVAALLSHDNGVLNGTTAFGKTVATIGLIAERGVNTLIIVTTKALLDQWKSRLEEFLDIDYKEETVKKRGRRKAFSPFGTYDSNGNSLHGLVDIALM